MLKQVLVAAPISNKFKSFLLNKGYEIITYNGTLVTPNTYVGIVCNNSLYVKANVINACPILQWIARVGSGMEIIDTQLAASKNIAVINSPGGLANAVAEHAIGLLIALQKNIIVGYNQITAGDWIREPNRGAEITDKTIALIGLGKTGLAFAHKLSVFGAKVIGFDKYVNTDASFVQQVTLEEVYATADVVSYHVPINIETANYYNHTLFAKPHILINTSRGGVATTSNIIAGLTSKHLITAGLDVLDFEDELPFNDTNLNNIKKLLSYNCIITPHIAGYSFNATTHMCNELQAKLDSIL